MTKRVSKIASSLKQIGDIQVTEWDFMALMNTELKELEITRSLTRLGSIQVMEWDFKKVLPAVKRAANHEVDFIDIFKRSAHYKVMEWDFRSALPTDSKPTLQKSAKPAISRADMQAIILRLKNFLQYIVVNLIENPNHAQVKVTEMGPTGLRFKLVLVKKDVMVLIGREGHTASAIRNLLKASVAKDGVQALLQIHSHEEEAAFLAKAETRH